MRQKLRDLIWARDGGVCWHCGREDNLVIHHRANRGMGGSPAQDRASNCLLVCNEFNIQMESYLPAAREARDRGLKISREASPVHTPIRRFDNREFLLDDFGKIHEINEVEF